MKTDHERGPPAYNSLVNRAIDLYLPTGAHEATEAFVASATGDPDAPQAYSRLVDAALRL